MFAVLRTALQAVAPPTPGLASSALLQHSTVPANYAAHGGLFTYTFDDFESRAAPPVVGPQSVEDMFSSLYAMVEGYGTRYGAPPRTAFGRRGFRASPATPAQAWVPLQEGHNQEHTGAATAVVPAEPHKHPAHDRNCCLCLEPLAGQLLRLPCGHHLHWECRQAVQHYASGKGQCPECRAPAPWPLPDLVPGCVSAVLGAHPQLPRLFSQDPPVGPAVVG
jgi:hypothetical protein